ncbi:MAG TPA: PilW family protein [Thiobacillus sp.]|nr:PilW family protein [Thiobacillus sp.]
MKPVLISSREQTGFGLIELMIAMTLGLVLLGGIGYVYIGSRGAFRTTDNLSRIQENARYALDMMSRDIRMAGYVGCGNLASMPVKTIAKPPVPPITAGNALIGYDNGTGWTNPTSIVRAAGDVLSVMGAFSSGANLTGNLIPSNANVQVNGNPDGFEQGDVLIVTNCSQADVFKVTNHPNNSGIVTLTHGSGSNTGNRVGTYGKDAFVMRMNQYSYFIGDTLISASRPVSVRALYRVGLNGVAEELVEHVHDMQLRYGLDTSATPDGRVDSYSNAPGNWKQVVSVTVNLLMRSPDNNISTATQSVTFNNGTFAAPDRRLYQVFSATVGVRNRLPAM